MWAKGSRTDLNVLSCTQPLLNLCEFLIRTIIMCLFVCFLFLKKQAASSGKSEFLSSLVKLKDALQSHSKDQKVRATLKIRSKNFFKKLTKYCLNEEYNFVPCMCKPALYHSSLIQSCCHGFTLSWCVVRHWVTGNVTKWLLKNGWEIYRKTKKPSTSDPMSLLVIMIGFEIFLIFSCLRVQRSH